MKNIYGITIKELEEYFVNIGEKKFKGTQVFEWLYRKRVKSFDEMTNIKSSIIEKLKSDFSFKGLELVDKKIGIDVCKFLYELHDSQKIEAVFMNHDYGNSLCVSSQVGCNMGCTFCESGRLKKIRDLSVEEMVLQVLSAEENLGVRISHIVLMGIGEPFDNYDNVIKFIDILNTPKGIELGSRHITISTCGIIPKIKEFMNYDKQVNLAISLHAPNDELRSKIMPINKAYPILGLINVLKEYIKKTNRRLTFEYILLDGINDSEECAIELSKLLKDINCYVNLIPYNETSHIEYKKSNKKAITDFYNVLKQNNISVTIRREFGSTVDAACGQLRSKYEEEK